MQQDRTYLVADLNLLLPTSQRIHAYKTIKAAARDQRWVPWAP
jgi:hypothetical protein